MKELFRNIKKHLSGLFRKKKAWKEIEYFDPVWENRVKQMAAYIPHGNSVLDLGCGKKYLEKYMRGGKYYPVDYTSRGEGTIICDFNKQEFPSQYVDVCFVSGTMEYLEDYNWFITKLNDHSNRAVISYCTTDNFPDLANRRNNAWVNHLSEKELVENFSRHGFKLVEKTETETKNGIFVFDSK